MKKSLIALAVLGSFAGAASAANTVTLWGRVDTAYQSIKTVNTNAAGVRTTSPVNNGKLKMYDAGESRIGIKVKEDLGNGLNAFVRLEGSMTSDVGTSVAFNRESVIGLGTSFGDVYFGRSNSPMDKVNISAGNRSGDLASSYAGYSGNNRWSNTAFYAYSQNGLSIYAGVSTKGGQFNNLNATEQHAGTKPAYGLAVKYAGKINANMGYSVAAAYQALNDKSYVTPVTIGAVSKAGVKNTWLVNGTFTFQPVTVGLSYSAGKYYTAAPATAKHVKYRANVTANVTANDSVYVEYTGEKDTFNNAGILAANTKTQTWGLGYRHSLSKRTSVFFNAGRMTAKKSDTPFMGVTSTIKARTTSYDLGLRHTF